MPELPDVSGFEAGFERHALNKTVMCVRVPVPRILEGLNPQTLGRHLKGDAFTATYRHGKFLFASTSEQQGWLVMHFGMTGNFAVYEKGEPTPKHAAVVFEFSEEPQLAYVSQRMLGKVKWTDELDTFIKEQDLGPDALSSDLSVEQMAEVLHARRGMLKSALMNQTIFAGIGNEWSDEILFQCGIHPKIKIDDLEFEDLSEVCRTGRRVLRTGSGARRKSHQLPPHYLGAHRHGDGLCPKCQGELATVKASGRTAYYCPNCQKSP